ncbi:MAG: heat-inducible transcriptional repressor HrcA [Anaerolineales bacterium]
MTALSERQELMLSLIIREFVENAQPVGSKGLVDKYRLGFSSATVRNDMVALTDAGLLRQPHTSAGRVPTDEGYRYFVEKLIGEADLPNAEKRMISHQFFQAQGDVDQWLRLAASVLAQHSSVAALVTAPLPERIIFRHLELIPVQGRQILLVLVLSVGEVQQQMIALAEPVAQSLLSQTSQRVTSLCASLDTSAIQACREQLSGLERDVTGAVVEMMRRSDQAADAEVVYDGISNVLNQPEFADRQLAGRALHLIEERSLLRGFLASVLGPEIGGVHVVIGGEGDWEDLRDCSMVVARYGARGLATGAVGVLGPVRMAYGRSISAVRFVSEVMSDLVAESHSG